MQKPKPNNISNTQDSNDDPEHKKNEKNWNARELKTKVQELDLPNSKWAIKEKKENWVIMRETEELQRECERLKKWGEEEVKEKVGLNRRKPLELYDLKTN